MKGSKASDGMENAKPTQTGDQDLNVSRDIITDALAGLAPRGRITHRTGTHLDQYHGVSISPDGSKMLTANRDRTARLWDIASGQCLMVLEEHTGELRRVVFLNDGVRAVTTADDGTLRLWDLATGACTLVMDGRGGMVTAVAVSPDDRYVVSGSHNGTVRVWSLTGGVPESGTEETGNPVKKILVAGDGTFFVSLSSGNDICRWNLPDMNGPFPITSGRFPHPFKDIALTGDGKVVAAAWDGLYCFDMQTGDQERFVSFRSYRPYKIAVTPGGTRLVTCCHYRVILVVDRETGTVEKELTGHSDDVTGMEISPDGKTLCTVSLDWTCRTWDIATGECLRTLRPARNLHGLSLSPGGKALAAHDKGGAARVWNLANGANRVVTREASSIAFLPIASLLATGRRDGDICLWEMRSNRTEPVAVLKAHTGPVEHLVPLREGALLATCAVNEVRLWDVQRRDCIGTLSIGGQVAALAVDEGMERIAVSCVMNTDILLFGLRSGAEHGLLKGHTWPGTIAFSSIRGLHFVSHGRGLISCGRDGRVILWDLVKPGILRSVEEKDSDVTCMAVEDDERHVMVGTFRGSLERWDLESGLRQVLWPGEEHPVLSIAVSPDKERLFASLGDGTVRIVDARSGVLVCSLWNVNDGFFWFTPPDEHAPDGWVWTDRDDLLHVVEESGEGRVLGAVPLADDRRRTYVHTRNNPVMVQARLKGLDEYERIAGRYTRSLAGKKQGTTARPHARLTEGKGNE